MTPWLKILRLPNLLIIILTQLLFRICVVGTFFGLSAAKPGFGNLNFILLVAATVLIAAGGYVINDYFDIATDKINKPGKLIAGKSISKGKLQMYFWMLTIPGVILGFILSIRVDYFLLGFIFPAVADMLWYYSEKYQKTIVTGNLMISLLSGLVILIVWIFEMFALIGKPVIYVEVMNQVRIVSILAFAYAGFAFFMTLIREILKDAEDACGDRISGYKTLPVVYGLQASKKVAISLQVLIILLLGGFQYFLYVRGLTLVFWYLLITVQILLVYLIYSTSIAGESKDFHFPSNVSKIIMVAGILSMELIYISY